MSKPETYIVRDERIRERALSAVRSLDLSKQWEVRIKEYARRSLDQNAKLWALLADLSNQVVWHGQKLTKENWKDVLTAALKRQAVVPGIEGGFVVLGTSTSRMRKAEFSELVELIYAFGAEHDVKWTDKGESWGW